MSVPIAHWDGGREGTIHDAGSSGIMERWNMESGPIVIGPSITVIDAEGGAIPGMAGGFTSSRKGP